jgi:hypothetical protein
MTHPHDPIDAALRAPAYLEDDHFTDGVMAALPPRRARPRAPVLLVASLVAAGLGAATLGEPVAAAAAVLSASSGTGLLLGGALLTLALGAFLRAAR